MHPGDASEVVTVNGDDSDLTGSGRLLQSREIAALAEDPDELKAELQMLSVGGGGSLLDTKIFVDGFQSQSTLPPKSSIAYIKINPDLFSAEYQEPPYTGGRIEVYTKPGQSMYHGSLAATSSSSILNARDPFSVGPSSVGKQRYGIDLNGPLGKPNSDFAVSVDYRAIDNIAAVNAETIASNDVPQLTAYNVPTPQRLWLASLRLGWLTSNTNSFVASFNTSVNSLANLGVGGIALAENGYDSSQSESSFRLVDVSTPSSKITHEARASLRLRRESDYPLSTAPQLSVAGSFVGGGATLQNQSIHDSSIEVDDDVILLYGKHVIKGGIQTLTFFERESLPSNFNGTYIFGGGNAVQLDSNGQPVPGPTNVISGLEQYRRALVGLSGGAATAYTSVTGAAQVRFNQVHFAAFFQDQWKVSSKLQMSYGLRYSFQTSPTTLAGAAPRIGVNYTFGKEAKWIVRAHTGLFSGHFDPGNYAELLREDGTNRVSSTLYNAPYNRAAAAGAQVFTRRTLAPQFTNSIFSETNVGLDHDLGRGWKFNSNIYYVRIWNDIRSKNINAPFNGQVTGPRPGSPGQDILQVQQSASDKGTIVFASVNQSKIKRLSITVSGLRVDVRGNSDNDPFFTPQSSFSDVGEYVRRSTQSLYQVFGNGSLHLPAKLSLSTIFGLASGTRFNVITGLDNNGDGDFNDRPQYAPPVSLNGISTPFGELMQSGGSGVLPRNIGVKPWTIHLDSNLTRAFSFGNKRTDGTQRSVLFSVRSANILNHTNITQVGNVLNSPLFDKPYTADYGRRVELGVRYSF